MEADHWPTPDFYQSSKALLKWLPRGCPDCFGLNMGGPPMREVRIRPLSSLSPPLLAAETEARRQVPVTNPGDLYKVYLGPRGNMGMCFSRKVWEQLHSKAHIFCK